MKILLSTTAAILLLITSLSANAKGVVCADFSSQAEAQRYFDAKKAGYKRLDRDKDGIACESL
ncbi:excalibur calcium-binding domain-containing protein [uncultured Psychrobacter sp.]|uniref:excalibur calcium-binding domain-containing protein n=1 Tax=uncultured Psychrobacter sp. TaxID=259303 RepID=UPI00260ECB9A|nr:excalibur calcium-binding domain-containing protein [uncultured Psychrobacter sp.]